MATATGENDAQFKRLVHVRRGNKSVATKLANQVVEMIRNIEGCFNTEVSAKLYSLEATLKEKQSLIGKPEDDILDKINVDLINKEIEESAEWQMKIRETLNSIELFRNGEYSNRGHNTADSTRASTPPLAGTSSGPSQPTMTSNATPISPSSPPLSGQDTHDQSLNNSISSGIRLPKINLVKFRGDITHFNSFWQSFECTIHSNESLSEVHKLSYLMTLLEGPAYNVVAGLDLTVENYKHAIESLKSPFGNRQKFVDAHMQAFLKLQECPNDNVMNL